MPESVSLGIYMDDPAASRMWADQGFRLQCIGFDGQMLLHRAAEVVAIASAQDTARAAGVQAPTNAVVGTNGIAGHGVGAGSTNEGEPS